MFRFLSHIGSNGHLHDAEQLLSAFGLTAAIDDGLRIRPAGPSLTYEELDTIVQRLLEEHVDDDVSTIAFDFGTVEWIAPPWTAVFARLIDFARATEARCVLSAMHGQPAAVADYFFRSVPIMRSLLLIAPQEAPPISNFRRQVSA